MPRTFPLMTSSVVVEIGESEQQVYVVQDAGLFLFLNINERNKNPRHNTQPTDTETEDEKKDEEKNTPQPLDGTTSARHELH